jgi:predicted  nucleic acid-binding Zn-ribbon protein
MGASDIVGELIVLQGIDLAVLKVNEELECLKEELSVLTSEVEELEAKEVLLRDRAGEAEQRVQRFQRSVNAGRETLKRLEMRVAAVANMQQHFAVKSETDTARRNLRTAEDDQLSAMQDAETARVGLMKVGGDLAQAKEALASREIEVGRQRLELERQLEAHTTSRKEQEGRIDMNTLRLYRSVSAKRTDSALAAIVEGPADGVCGRCYTTVPKQRRADIRSGRSVALCEGCGVILHVEMTDA